MRNLILAAALIAMTGLMTGLTLSSGNATTHHYQHSQQTAATQQQDDDPSDSVAEAGQDLVNVVVNVGRTTGRALSCLFGDENHC